MFVLSYCMHQRPGEQVKGQWVRWEDLKEEAWVEYSKFDVRTESPTKKLLLSQELPALSRYQTEMMKMAWSWYENGWMQTPKDSLDLDSTREKTQSRPRSTWRITSLHSSFFNSTICFLLYFGKHNLRTIYSLQHGFLVSKQINKNIYFL